MIHPTYHMLAPAFLSTQACCRRTTPVYYGRRKTGKPKDITWQTKNVFTYIFNKSSTEHAVLHLDCRYHSVSQTEYPFRSYLLQANTSFFGPFAQIWDRKVEFNFFFAKNVPEYKIPYLWKFCAIKSTGSAINTALFKGG